MNFQYITFFILINSILSYSQLARQSQSPNNMKPKIHEHQTPARYKFASKSFKYSPAILAKQNASYAHFPDVEYPTNIIDSSKTFYLNSDGCNVVLSAFPDDVKSSFKTINSKTKKGTAASPRYPPIRSLIHKETPKVVPSNEIKQAQSQKKSNEMNNVETDSIGDVADTFIIPGLNHSDLVMANKNITYYDSDDVLSEESLKNILDIYRYDTNDTSIYYDEYTFDYNSYETTYSTSQPTEETTSAEVNNPNIDSLQAYLENFFNHELLNGTIVNIQTCNGDYESEHIFKGNLNTSCDGTIPINAAELITSNYSLFPDTD